MMLLRCYPQVRSIKNFNENIQLKQKSLISEEIRFDFIIVGSGSGGSVMIGRMSESRHHTVLAMEAACGDPMDSSEVK